MKLPTDEVTPMRPTAPPRKDEGEREKGDEEKEEEELFLRRGHANAAYGTLAGIILSSVSVICSGS
jgi:hypothetical protein